MSDFLKKFSNWIIAAIVAAVIVIIVYFYQISNNGYSALNLIRYLGDGFFVAAVLYLGLGALTWIADIGGFNGLKFLTYNLVSVFTPRNSRFKERKNYYEFLQEQEKKEKKGNKAMLICGTVCLIISLILSFVFGYLAV